MQKTYSESEIHETAAWLWQQIQLTKVVALHGHMGAGKTTLVTALGNFLHIPDTISSPTFSIINEYVFTEKNEEKKIYHIDLYRLKSEEEAILAGVEDCIYSGHLCIIEWPERAAGLFPPETLHIHISLTADDKRLIEIRN